MTIDRADQAIVRALCGDIGDSMEPFSELAGELDISEDELLSRINSYAHGGLMRRFGAVLRHQKAGFTANGMSVWNVPGEDVARVGEHLASLAEVSHCYERKRFEDWSYNVYAMIHGRQEKECIGVAERASETVGIDDYMILFSGREFKKTSMIYFAEDLRE